MLSQIITRTPVWVWPLLAFLVYRGILGTRDRETSLRNLFILPIVMLGLSLQGVLAHFGLHADDLSFWMAGAVAAGALAWLTLRRDGVRVHHDRGAVTVRGSWAPLALILAIFATKYVTEVLMAIDPARQGTASFVLPVCLLYGIFNGVFMGKLLRVVALYRRAASPAA
jgi:hypothetical protein